MAHLRTDEAVKHGRTDTDPGTLGGSEQLEPDDDTLDLVGDLLRAHGYGFSDGIRALCESDPAATRRAVVRHLGSTVLGYSRGDLARRAGLSRDSRLRAGAPAPGGDPRGADASPLTWDGDQA